jgi:hypothetical protein
VKDRRVKKVVRTRHEEGVLTNSEGREAPRHGGKVAIPAKDNSSVNLYGESSLNVFR